MLVVPARPSLAQRRGYWDTLEAATGIAGVAEVVRAVLETPPPVRRIDRDTLRALEEALVAVLAEGQPAAQALTEAQLALAERQATFEALPSPTSGPVAINVATPMPEVAADDTTAITFRFQPYGPDGQEARALRLLAERFGQEYPAISVQIRPYDVFAGDSLHKVAATSDCFSWGFGGPPDKAIVTATLDLQPLIDADSTFDLADYPPPLLALFRHGSGLYGLPDQVGFRVLYYHKAAFDARGVAYPAGNWTLDELLKAAQQLTYEADGERHYGFASFGWLPGDLRYFLDRFEARAVRGRADAPQPNYTDPKVLEAVRFYVDLLRDFSPHTQIDGAVLQRERQDLYADLNAGRIGMWFEDRLLSGGYYGDLPYEVGIAPPPLATGSLSPYDIHTTRLHISARTQHVAECWAWLKYLGGDVTHMQLENWFPAWRSLAESDTFRQQAGAGAAELYAAYQAALERTPPIREDQAFFETFGPELDTYWLFQAVERALSGQNLERALAEAQAITEAYGVCYQAQRAWVACAREVDPQYQGYGLVLERIGD